jgi:ubiquinone/menaquinone biosynthesis C-methylase UbiE
MTAEHRPATSPAALLQMMQAHHVTAVLAAAIDLGVFGAIHRGSRDAAAIAEAIGCPERTTNIVVEALVALGLLEKQSAGYELTPTAAEFLVPGGPRYLGDMANMMASTHIWQALSTLKDAVRAGGSVLPEHAETPRLPFWEVFAKNTTGLSMPGAMAIRGLLGPWLEARKAPSLLDVAAGSGTYGLTLVKEISSLRATLLDWPNVLAETRQWAERFGVDRDRVSYLEGNLFETDFGGPYDVVLMSQIFHHFEPAVCQSLAKKAAAALKPDGKLVIHDFLIDGDNPAARMFAVTMLGTTKKGESFSSDDYRRWCAAAGLTAFEVRTPPGLPTSIVVAQRG